MVLGKAGAAEVIEQKNASPEKLIAEIEKLYNSPEKVTEMSEAAALLHMNDTNERILAVVEKLIHSKK